MRRKFSQRTWINTFYKKFSCLIRNLLYFDKSTFRCITNIQNKYNLIFFYEMTSRVDKKTKTDYRKRDTWLIYMKKKLQMPIVTFM